MRGAIAISAPLLLATAATAQWPHWGGPTRDFRAPASRLAPNWPENGPRRLWSRPLGHGHSSIVAAGDRLFTMWGKGTREHVVCLDAATGEVRWDTAYDVGYVNSNAKYAGPHATPSITGDVVVTVGIDGKVHALDIETGEVRWRRDLLLELDADIPQSGYAASPLLCGDLVLLPGQGTPGYGVIALRIANGSTAWARHGFLSSHATPLLVRIEERDIAVFHGTNRMYGIDPKSGDVLWTVSVRRNAIDNVSFPPLFDAKNSVLLVSHAYDGKGLQAFEVRRNGETWSAKRKWSNRRLKVEHGNGVILGRAAYASDGSDYIVSVDLDTGRTRFKQRGIPKSTFLAAGDKLLVLDDDGDLHIAKPSEDDLGVLASATVIGPNPWAVPTIVGNTVYVRDRERVVALSLP